VFPNLVRTPGGRLHSSATGVPDAGNNTFDLGLEGDLIDRILASTGDDWLTIRVWSLGQAVQNATFVSRSGSLVTVDFGQAGQDPCFVEAEITHSEVR